MFRSLFNMTAITRNSSKSKTRGSAPKSRKRKPKAWRLVEFSDGRIVQFPA